MKKMMLKSVTALSVGILLSGCFVDDAKDAVDDVAGTVALENVKFTTDTVEVSTVDVSNMSDADKQNASKYTISITHKLSAENTGGDEAKFSGADIRIKAEPANAETINMPIDPFTVPGNETVISSNKTSINGADHKNTCKYVFGKIADSAEITLNVDGDANWEIGSSNGKVPLNTQQVKTTVAATSEERAAFRKAVDDGVFN